jgi:thiamine pyrophosphokinase
MKKVGIVGGGPTRDLPNLSDFNYPEMIWIGADQGTMYLLDQGIKPNMAVGDFDSISEQQLALLQKQVDQFYQYPAEKDETDLELALLKAIEMEAEEIYLFGVTGGRLDHEFVNIQSLYNIEKLGIKGVVINKGNWLELKSPGAHTIINDPKYEYISFVPQTVSVNNLSLEGFYYPLHKYKLELGSSICVSNRLIGKKGTFSFDEGILLLIKSHDVLQ